MTGDSLAMNLAQVRPEAECKICGQTAALHGVVDFNKTCEANRGRFFPLSGVPVWYHRCGNCGFLFSAQFDAWTPAMFRQYIYNEAYIDADPDAGGARANGNAAATMDLARQTNARRVLDYGGGDGTLARILVENGLDGVSWDPVRDGDGARPDGGFDFVTAFEVLEHTPTPVATCQQALSFLHSGGLLFFSTLMLDGLATQACDNWYIAPRNGHISIHTARSLELLFAGLGRTVHHFSQAFHLAVPAR